MSDPAAGANLAGASAVRSSARRTSTQHTSRWGATPGAEPGRSARRPKGSHMTIAVDRTEILWTAVCPYSRLAPDRGVAALVGGAQVAIFRTADGDVYA